MKKLIILSLILFSCGARHVQTDKVETKLIQTIAVNSIDTTKIITNSDQSTTIVDNSLLDNLTIESKDTTKPIVIDGHTYRNVIIKHERSKNNIITTKLVNVAKTEQKGVNIKVKETKKLNIIEKKKQIVRSSSYWWLLWLLLLLPIYFVWKKYKDEVWFI